MTPASLTDFLHRNIPLTRALAAQVTEAGLDASLVVRHTELDYLRPVTGLRSGAADAVRVRATYVASPPQR